MKLSEPVTNDNIAVKFMRKVIPRGMVTTQEFFIALILDTQLRAIGRAILVAMGTVNTVEVHSRDIFREAIKKNAYGIILAHNHPSGSLKPSSEDVKLACKLEESGKILGIQVLDNIIITKDKHISKVEGGWE
ncbi:MAG: JAB domain-containing protein [Patescibacteria group bacterium]